MVCFCRQKTIMTIIQKFVAVFLVLFIASPAGCIGNQLCAEYNMLQAQVVTSKRLEEVIQKKFPATETKALLRAIKNKDLEEVQAISKAMDLGSVSEIAESLAK
jgi:hypothetical protein